MTQIPVETIAAQTGGNGMTMGISEKPPRQIAIPAILLVTGVFALNSDGDARFLAATTAILSLVLLAIWWWRAQRRGGAHMLLLSMASVMIFVPGVRDDVGRLLEGQVRVWNVYHYYLGSKYFKELGYTGLYAATLKADREGRNYWAGQVGEIRDLETYDVIDVEDALSSYAPSDHFTPDRWADFRADVEALAPHRSARGWREIFVDRGYNPPPVWTAIGGFVSQNTRVDKGGLLFLASLDILLLLAMGAAVARAFGTVPALLVAVLFVASPMNIPRAFGGFLQFDWLASIVFSVCLMQTRRFGWAGAAVAYALMTRIFPLFMIAGFFVPVLAQLIRTRNIPANGLRFLLGVAAASAGLFALSLLPGSGLYAWRDFLSAILTHSGDHVLGERRIGLEHILTAGPDWLGDMIDKADRAVLLQERAHLYWIACTVMVIAYLAAAWHSKPANAFILGMIVVFGLLVLSRYYFGIIALVPLIARTGREAYLLTGLQLGVFAAVYTLDALGAENHMQYVALNIGLTAHFGLVMMVASRKRPATGDMIEHPRGAV